MYHLVKSQTESHNLPKSSLSFHISETQTESIMISIVAVHHHHKHQGFDPLIRSVSRVTAACANTSLVFQLFSFLMVCSGMISKGFGFVAFFASVKASSSCIHLTCLVCLQSVVRGVWSYLFCGHKGCSRPEVSVT